MWVGESCRRMTEMGASVWAIRGYHELHRSCEGEEWGGVIVGCHRREELMDELKDSDGDERRGGSVVRCRALA